jgi:hypothetical protein
MATELAGDTPVPFPRALTMVNRGWLDVQRSFLWSFLWGDAAIPTPIPITTGTVTLVRGLSQVVGDADASTAWANTGLVNPITTMQFRIGQGTIYNIIAYDDGTSPTSPNPGFGTITLATPYVDPTSGAGSFYQIYGVYYNAPSKDFIWWESIKDPISGYDISTTYQRETVDMIDPQRFQGGWPSGVLPYLINPFPGNFKDFPMYEIWPAPLQNYTYVGTYYRSGMPFVKYTDTVNSPLGEDVVIAAAKIRCYEWCIANPDKVAKHEGSARVGASGFQFLMGQAQKEKKDLLNDYILMDEGFSHRHTIPDLPVNFENSLPWVSMRNLVMSNV